RRHPRGDVPRGPLLPVERPPDPAAPAARAAGGYLPPGRLLPRPLQPAAGETDAGPRARRLPAARAVPLAGERTRAAEPDGAGRRSRRRCRDRAELLPPAPAPGRHDSPRVVRGDARTRARDRRTRAEAHPARPELCR